MIHCLLHISISFSFESYHPPLPLPPAHYRKVFGVRFTPLLPRWGRRRKGRIRILPRYIRQHRDPSGLFSDARDWLQPPNIVDASNGRFSEVHQSQYNISPSDGSPFNGSQNIYNITLLSINVRFVWLYSIFVLPSLI